MDSFFLVGAIAKMRARISSYSGEVWEAIFASAQIKGKEENILRGLLGKKPKRVRWVLDETSAHCMDRPGFYGCEGLAKEYDSWDAMPTVPGGQTACLTNCRCHVEIQNDDGTWDMAI